MISEGAESKIFKVDNSTLKKLRPEKKYRIAEIDKKLRKTRNNKEFKILEKLSETIINTPKPIEKIYTDEEISFTFEFIDGNILKEVINENLLLKAFNQIILLHNMNIVHGDLTTLNMIEKDNEVYLIDFGLSDTTRKSEDKAVDLNLFFLSIKNEHPDLFHEKDRLVKLYNKEAIDGDRTVKSLENIEKRGRNKNK
jgi:Kae1-associated kinase Bud32